MLPRKPWGADPAARIIGELEASFKKHPPIKLGTPDPYTPPEPVLMHTRP